MPDYPLPTRLLATCETRAGEPAIIDAGERLSYADFECAAREAAHQLSALGCVPDEPVLVPVSNCARDLVAFLAVWLAGGVVIPVHRAARTRGVEDLARRTDARFVVNLSPGHPVSAKLIEARGVGRIRSGAPAEDDALRGAAWVVFTSGSTGEPKGVVLDHARYAAKLDMIDGQLAFSPRDHTLLLLQLTFSFGQWVALVTLANGGTLTLHEKFEPEAMLRSLSTGITRVAMVPSMVRSLRAGQPGLPHFAGTVMLGGEVMPAPLLGWLGASWPEARVWDIFGLTETATSDFLVRPEDYPAAAGSIGTPGPGIDFRLAPEDGELQIRTPFVMRGYLGAPSLTAHAFDGEWFRTGDLARLRADGRVEIVGRRNDLINRGGNKVAPLEVERVFLEHPQVHAALATAVPDEGLGQAIHLCLVAHDGVELSEQTLRAWVAERLEPYKQPDQYSFAGEIPVGRTGKADRASLARRVAGQRRQ